MRRRAAAFGGLVLVLVATSCGSADEEPVATVEDPLAALQAASTTTSDVSSYRMALSITSDEGDDPCSEAFGLTADLEAALTRADDAIGIEVIDNATGAAGRHIDGTTYIEAAALPDWGATTPWISVTAADWDEHPTLGLTTMAFSLLDLREGEDFDPPSLEEMVGMFDEGGVTVTEVGAEEVRGEPTTHYRVEIDPAAAYPEVGNVTGELIISSDAWVDADGYIRRISSTNEGIDLNGLDDETPAEGLSLSIPPVTTELEIWDHGADITIEAPAPDEVTPITDLDAPESADSLLPDLLEQCLPERGPEAIEGAEDLEGIGGIDGSLDQQLACLEAFADQMEELLGGEAAPDGSTSGQPADEVGTTSTTESERLVPDQCEDLLGDLGDTGP